MKIVSIISQKSGGGAEKLAEMLHLFYLEQGYSSELFFFQANENKLNDGETVLSGSIRSLMNIYYIRKEIKKRMKVSKGRMVIHAHLTWPFFYTVLATIGLERVELIYTEHSTYNRRRVIRFLRYIEYFFYSRYKRIICISEGTKDSLLNWCPWIRDDSINVIYNGINLPGCIERKINPDDLKVVSVGSLTNRKNFIAAVKALALIKDSFKTYEIIGEGPLRAELLREIQEQGLSDKVFLRGWQDDIYRFYKKSDLMLIPSKWEGFGLVAIEAMATGLPVVASKVDGLSEVLKCCSSAFFVDDPNCRKEWVSQIQLALNTLRGKNPQYLWGNSRKHAELFQFNTMANNYLKQYKQHE